MSTIKSVTKQKFSKENINLLFKKSILNIKKLIIENKK